MSNLKILFSGDVGLLEIQHRFYSLKNYWIFFVLLRSRSKFKMLSSWKQSLSIKFSAFFEKILLICNQSTDIFLTDWLAAAISLFILFVLLSVRHDDAKRCSYFIPCVFTWFREKQAQPRGRPRTWIVKIFRTRINIRVVPPPKAGGNFWVTRGIPVRSWNGRCKLTRNK